MYGVWVPEAGEGAVAHRAHVSVGPGTGETRVGECFPKEPQSSVCACGYAQYFRKLQARTGCLVRW